MASAPKYSLNRVSLLKGVAGSGVLTAAGCSGGGSGLLVPAASRLGNNASSRLVQAQSITPNASSTNVTSFTDSGYTFTFTQTATSVTLSYSKSGSTPVVICTVNVDSTTSYFTTSPQNFSPVNTSLNAPNASTSVFNSSITPTSSSNANYTLGPTGQSGNSNYTWGATTTTGSYAGNASSADVNINNASGSGPCHSTHCPLGGVNADTGVAIGAGGVGIIGGIAAIAEIGFLITPAGFAIACVLMAGALFGMFFALPRYQPLVTHV